MRQEAEERKALEQERKKVEKEEQKYKNEIDKVKAQLSSANSEETAMLNAKISELESKLQEINQKRDSITALQNGKAGNVYVISNLGSFGENVFKIGMTRRLDPLDRINELGSASVPFRFDVHSFIFSEDAVSLETKLHHMLNNKRVNKVNMRKEFFYSTIDELETLVHQIDPTAEFNRTMVAEEYNQSLSIDEIYTSEITEDELSDDDD
ncbi:MAG: GIY-YIG nuclease family protein [Clostridia bacterium]|nr:GIY-YIG nuclease family protein [Clostridia bacterium]